MTPEWIDEIKRRWQRAQPQPRQECVDINELATLSDEIPKLIAAVEFLENELAFYASKRNWHVQPGSHVSNVQCEGEYIRAQDALAKLQSGEFGEADES